MITVFHIEGNCNKIAFYLRERVYPGERITASNMILLNGSIPQENTPIICGSCRRHIFYLSNETIEQRESNWTDWFIKD